MADVDLVGGVVVAGRVAAGVPGHSAVGAVGMVAADNSPAVADTAGDGQAVEPVAGGVVAGSGPVVAYGPL